MPKIGDYTLCKVETGTFGLDGGAMFGIVPKPLWSRQITPDEQNRIPLHMRCLLLQSTDRLIMIDAGIGHKYSEKFAGIYAIDHSKHSICAAFDQLGVSTDEVTDVILTHLHFDHCGGATYRNENGELGLTFRNAQHYVQREHYEWARSSNPKEAASFLKENISPLANSGKLTLVDGKKELLPGISVIPVGGHTEAQQLVKISDGDSTLVYVADLIPTTHHVKPAWTMAYDIEPLVSIDEKMQFLEQAVENEWDLFFEHDPEVEVASVEKTEKGIRLVDARALEQLHLETGAPN